jgi:hypothetical protein
LNLWDIDAIPNINIIIIITNELFVDILQSRTDMEQQSIEGASTSEAVGFITVVQSLKRKLKSWDKNVEVQTLNSNREKPIFLSRNKTICLKAKFFMSFIGIIPDQVLNFYNRNRLLHPSSFKIGFD